MTDKDKLLAHFTVLGFVVRESEIKDFIISAQYTKDGIRILAFPMIDTNSTDFVEYIRFQIIVGDDAIRAHTLSVPFADFISLTVDAFNQFVRLAIISAQKISDLKFECDVEQANVADIIELFLFPKDKYAPTST